VRTYTGFIIQLLPNQIFVFGSNFDGHHGDGTARIAYNEYDAVWGQARGLQGRSYAIITTDLRKRGRPNVPESIIVSEIIGLYQCARSMPDKDFMIAYTAEGRNRCGYSSKELACMFYVAGDGDIPDNIVFEDKFAELVKPNYLRA
jgi:hypothetical protein